MDFICYKKCMLYTYETTKFWTKVSKIIFCFFISALHLDLLLKMGLYMHKKPFHILFSFYFFLPKTNMHSNKLISKVVLYSFQILFDLSQSVMDYTLKKLNLFTIIYLRIKKSCKISK